ncbi:MAG: chromosomal replication initiator protein DnaA [Verrucomicrobiae bacterium]|nr:chromosomal replication initiator protein DnaA [Verrucomicrobiae bacterium]
MDVSAQEVWTKALKILEQTTSPKVFELWFSHIKPSRIEKEEFYIEVGNEFHEIWIHENYEPYIVDALKTVTGTEYKIVYEENRNLLPEQIGEDLIKVPSKVTKIESEEPLEVDGRFDKSYTFETFIVGGSNQMAHAAAMAIAQSPGISYNPFFLYGGSGLGKTHLLHAIGNYVLGHRKNMRVVYISAEKFTNEYIESIRNIKTANFRKKYRNTDVLLIDDVQFLANKERIQEEFFHTFNALYEAHKQIVLTCDRPVKEIQNLQERLVTRFEWGLVADLQPPDLETRIAILKSKSAQQKVTIPDNIVLFLAENIRSDVRRLEGALYRIKGYQQLAKKQIDFDKVQEILGDILMVEAKKVITIEDILKIVAEEFGLRVSDLTGRRRSEDIAFPRQIAMYLAREFTHLSTEVIGQEIGGRDHGTVIYACKVIRNRMDVDKNVKDLVHRLEWKLKGGRK